ncbi:hypothetical protein E5347_01385 [Clostridium sartagoforme]|uniref:Lipoprotein n=1 Tax=Clostridium sartagoforme TaxID=84031 RepID=A0A4S2DR15_9CLOT|nr:hypothetical protein [Clostridium sartagoforme]TGY43491.1 hypothetical protein E5347_01385 [Clostridium sartagoforme]
MKKLLIFLVLSTLALTSCSLNDSDNQKKELDNKTSEITENNINNSSEEDKIDNSNNGEQENIEEPSDIDNIENISYEVKNYIIKGQDNKSEAEKLKWSKTFLDNLDINSIYSEYLSSGGTADDIEELAYYITENAPIPSDWEEMFKKDLYEKYGENLLKVEPLGNDQYQAYIEKEGKEVPYVVVSSRTGYFHG